MDRGASSDSAAEEAFVKYQQSHPHFLPKIKIVPQTWEGIDLDNDNVVDIKTIKYCTQPKKVNGVPFKNSCSQADNKVCSPLQFKKTVNDNIEFYQSLSSNHSYYSVSDGSLSKKQKQILKNTNRKCQIIQMHLLFEARHLNDMRPLHLIDVIVVHYKPKQYHQFSRNYAGGTSRKRGFNSLT